MDNAITECPEVIRMGRRKKTVAIVLGQTIIIVALIDASVHYIFGQSFWPVESLLVAFVVIFGAGLLGYRNIIKPGSPFKKKQDES